MPLPDLIRLLHAVGFEPEAEDIADLLWLAGYLPPSPEPSPAPPITNEIKLADKRKTEGAGTETMPPIPDAHKTQALPAARSEQPAEAVLYARPSGAGLAYRASGVVSLRQRRLLRRALRPLMRRVPSANHFRLDEIATVNRIADSGQWQPVMTPEPTRWLELDIIVDEWPSMILWRQPVNELIDLFSGLGAFRSVQVWSFWTTADGSTVSLRNGMGAAAAGERPRPLRELVSVRGNRLMLLLSDCVSPAWGNGVMGRTLLDWAKSEIVALINPLPYIYWRRTGLGKAASVYLRAPAPGTPNLKLEARKAPGVISASVSRGLHLPVLTAEPDTISAWARAIAGRSSEWVLGVRLPVASTAPRPAAGQPAGQPAAQPVAPAPTPDPSSRVARFQNTATPEAWKLAGCLSYISPLSLPVMRLVHAVMLPTPRPEHLAEVYLSGLLRRAHSPAGELIPGAYEFQPGVAEILRTSLLRWEAADLFRRVRDHILNTPGAESTFQAVLFDPTVSPRAALPDGALPFASLPPEALRRLGGEYAALADALTGRITEQEIVVPVESETAPLSSANWLRMDIRIEERGPENLVIMTMENREVRRQHYFVTSTLLKAWALVPVEPDAESHTFDQLLTEALFGEEASSLDELFLQEGQVTLQIMLALPDSLQPLPWERILTRPAENSPGVIRSLLASGNLLITRASGYATPPEPVLVESGHPPAALYQDFGPVAPGVDRSQTGLDWRSSVVPQDLEAVSFGLSLSTPSTLIEAMRQRSWPVVVLRVIDQETPGVYQQSVAQKSNLSFGESLGAGESFTPFQVENGVNTAAGIGLLVLEGPSTAQLQALAARLLNPSDGSPHVAAVMVNEDPPLPLGFEPGRDVRGFDLGRDARRFALDQLMTAFFAHLAKTGQADTALLAALSERRANDARLAFDCPALHLGPSGGQVFILPGEPGTTIFPTPPLEVFTWYVSADRLPSQAPLNVRAGPGAQYPVVGNAFNGERLHLLDDPHTVPERLAHSAPNAPAWFHVRTPKDFEGFVHAGFADTLFVEGADFDAWVVLPDSQHYRRDKQPARDSRWRRMTVTDTQSGVALSLPYEHNPGTSQILEYELSPAAPDGQYRVEIFTPGSAAPIRQPETLSFGLPIGDIQVKTDIHLPVKAGWAVVGQGSFSFAEDNRAVTRLPVGREDTLTHYPLRFVPLPAAAAPEPFTPPIDQEQARVPDAALLRYLRSNLDEALVYLEILEIFEDIRYRSAEPLQRAAANDFADPAVLELLFEAEKSLARSLDQLEAMLDRAVLDSTNLNWMRQLSDIHSSLSEALRSTKAESEQKAIQGISRRLSRLLENEPDRIMRQLTGVIGEAQEMGERRDGGLSPREWPYLQEALKETRHLEGIWRLSGEIEQIPKIFEDPTPGEELANYVNKSVDEFNRVGWHDPRLLKLLDQLSANAQPDKETPGLRANLFSVKQYLDRSKNQAINRLRKAITTLKERFDSSASDTTYQTAA